MNNEPSKPIKILCILSFVVVAATSIPLLVAYLKRTSPEYPIVVDIHVWAGVIFIISGGLRIIRTKLKKQK
jgi:arginine exporter protein ArgO